ncbi:MAG: hypothetical protein LUQ12_05475 [Methanoregulaceae archaeon]|nr:hypothetical protein [Methanoregulaceae archaeon]
MIHLVIHFEGHADDAIMDRAVKEALFTEPLTMARFIPGEAPFFEPADTDPEMPAWACIRTSAVENTLAELLATPLDPLRGPMARIRLLRSDDDLLCISFNHTITDAYGVKSFGSLIARLYRSGTCNGGYAPAGNPHDRSFDSIFSLLGDKCGEASGRLGKRQGAWSIPFKSSGTGKRQYATKTIDSELFSCIRHYARIHGITVNDLLLSSYVLALAESAPSPPGTCNPVLTSIDLRRYLSPDMYPSLANLSVAFELPVKIPPKPALPEIELQVHTLMSRCKSTHTGIGAATLLCREFQSGFRHVEKELACMEEKTRDGLLGKNPFFTNLGVIPDGVIGYGVPVRTAWMLGPVEYPPGFGLAACTFRGCLTLSAGFSGEALEKDWVLSLLSSVAQNLSRFISPE